MNRFHLLTKQCNGPRASLFGAIVQRVQGARSESSSSSSSSSDDEKKTKRKDRPEEKDKSKEALDKLNQLLMSMSGTPAAPTAPKLDLAKPDNKREKGRVAKHQKQQQTPQKRIEKVVKDVAETVGGDPKQTQSELLAKLLNVTQDTSTNLRDLVKGMKVDNEKPPTKADQVQAFTKERPMARFSKPKQQVSVEKIDLFGSEPLGIFTEKTTGNEGVQNETWNRLYQRELKLAVTHPPANYFQQMILWTEQGKVWKFPIDNEQGLDDEQQVYFAEHVFLEKHLEPWCPPTGPLRHFMELVTVGLSKNHYLTVEAKREHIEWFRNYFEEKKQLLKETGAIVDKTPQLQ